MAGAGRLDLLAASVFDRFRARCPDGPLVVALSGGADSAVCAWAAARTASTRAVFVDHGLAESAALGEAAAAVAGALGVRCGVVTVQVDAGPSPEAQARTARHAALEAALEPGEWLLSGHTGDDQAETVLGNLLRGAGGDGLAGIPARRGRWVRPLLDVTRAETRELAALLGLPYADDPANEAASARRNVLRREVIPDLEARFNPRLREVLRRTAGLVAADDAELSAAAAAVPIGVAGTTVRLPAALLATLPVPVAGRAVRAALRRVRGPYGGTAREVAAALAVSADGPGRADLGGGWTAVREGPWLVIRGVAAPPAWTPATWRVPGPLTVPGVLRLDSWVEDAPPSPWPLGNATAVVDADAVGDELLARPALADDRVEVLGGSKAATDALAEAGVPARLRPSWPVVAAAGRLLWIAGVRTATWARPGPASKRFLWLSVEIEEQ